MLKELFSARILSILLTLIASIFLLQFFWKALIFFSDIILILFLAWLLSFLIDPLVDVLSEYRISRLLAATSVYLLIASLISGVVFLLLPIIIAQLLELSDRLPYLAQEAPKYLVGLENSLRSRGLNVDLTKTLEGSLTSLSYAGLNTADKLISLISSLFSTLFTIILVLIISFYFVIDSEALERRLLKYLPSNLQEETQFLIRTINSSFAGFLRGQLTVALFWGISVWLVMTVLGISFAPLAAITGGILMIIPVIGGLLGIIPALLASMLTTPQSLWVVILILTLIQAIEANILAPLIFEKTVGLHPVLVLISFLIGFKLGGLWGALFAVPIGSIAWAIFKEVLEHLRIKHRLFG